MTSLFPSRLIRSDPCCRAAGRRLWLRVLVADPGAALDGATVATVAHIIMEGRGVLLCSNCSITRDRIKRGLLALLGDAATGGRA